MGEFGAFGKMPALGDFFRVAIAPGFVDPWDRWLQTGMMAARQDLGERWQDCFMTAPPWRFTLAAGLAGPAAMIGVMMPSVDRVGRQFPLTLAAVLAARSDPLASHFAAAGAFAALETVALDCLDDSMTREVLADRLGAVHAPALVARGALRRGQGMISVASVGAAGLGTTLGVELASPGFRAPSVWSSALDGGERLLVVEGLPDPGTMTALFDLDAPLWQATLQQGAGA